MTLVRVVEPELLDGLTEQDPAAQRSRRDLRRVHLAMGTRRILINALQSLVPGAPPAPLRVLELGAGDGTLLLGVARAQRIQWPIVQLTLLDRQQLLETDTVAAYAAAGWTARALIGDALDWADPQQPGARFDLIVANLFLHHFEPAPLARLLTAVAARCDCFVACEPRRAALALAGSHLIGALGVNAVTRADAVASVHAGFAGKELSAFWPASAPGWTLSEYPAGFFSHCLTAVRTD
jgi:SAM-dependent methyltransferase